MIKPRGGSLNIGTIDEEAAKAAGIKVGPIRLLNGYSGRNAWGYLHIASRDDRMSEIRGLGFPTCQAYVFFVAANWTELQESGESGRIKAVVYRDGYELAIVIQWDGSFWSVTTALPFRPKGKRKLYVKAAT